MNDDEIDQTPNPNDPTWALTCHRTARVACTGCGAVWTIHPARDPASFTCPGGCREATA